MKKIQCQNIEKGENVHKHYCYLCEGKQHVPYAKALKYYLSDLLVLSNNGRRDASDYEMHDRIEMAIQYHVREHKYNGVVKFERMFQGEPIASLRACISTLKFIQK